MNAANRQEGLPSTPALTRAVDSMSQGSVGLTVLRTGLPLAIAMASHAMINLVDLALVGQLGKEAAAAAHIASVVNFVPMIVGNSISVAAMAVLSQQLGAGEQGRAQAFARASLRWMFVAGAVVSVLSALPAAICVDSIGSEGSVRSDAIHYLVVSNLGCLPMFVLMQATAVMRAAGETAAPLFVLLFANGLNLVLDVVLLFGWEAAGIPAIGVTGAAYATVASRAVAAVVALWWLHRPQHRFGVHITIAKERTPVAARLLHGAWPQVVQIGLRAAVVWGITAMVQRRLGDDGTAALAVTTRLDTLVLFSALGFASAATTVAGRAVASGEIRRARAAGLHAGLQAFLFGSAVVFAFQQTAEPMLRAFVPAAGPPVVAAGMLYVSVAAVAQPFAACALGAMGAPHGAGRMLGPLAVDLVGFAALLVSLLCAAQLELASIYLVLVGGAAALALLHLTLVAAGSWPLRRTVTD